ASSVVLQPDGKIVIAGTNYNEPVPESRSDIALLRLNANGSNDTSFGTGGVVLTNVDGVYDQANGVALQSTGAIIVGGAVGAPFPDDGVAAVLRFTPNGALDASFGSGGVAVTGAAGFTSATSVLVQPNGGILISGSATGASDLDLALARFTAGGSLDTSFGG